MAKVASDEHGLRDFLRKKKEETSSSRDVDWDAKRDDWVSSVERLYEFLKGTLLKDLIEDKTVEDSTELKQLAEEHIGTYTVPELTLKIGGEKVVFSPKGVTVIGAAGRVDLRGDRDTVTLVREKGQDGHADKWHVIVQRTPSIKSQPLDADSLKWALERVML